MKTRKPADDLAAAPARPVDRRDRRIQRTRRHLAEAAVQLFERNGYAATTVEQITEEAGYSSSTFFRLFADKQEVIFYDFDDHLEELEAGFKRPADHGNAWIQIREALIFFARRWDQELGEFGRQRARLFHREAELQARHLAKCTQWEAAIARLVSRDLHAQPRGELLSRVIAGAAVTAFRAGWQSQLARKQRTLADSVEDAFDQLENIGVFFRARPASRRGTLTRKSSAKLGVRPDSREV